jgi:hypothetical protein
MNEIKSNFMLIIISTLAAVTLIIACNRSKEKTIRLTEYELLLLTETCYMQGYLISRMGLNADSAWTEIAKPFYNVFR